MYVYTCTHVYHICLNTVMILSIGTKKHNSPLSTADTDQKNCTEPGSFNHCLPSLSS